MMSQVEYLTFRLASLSLSAQRLVRAPSHEPPGMILVTEQAMDLNAGLVIKYRRDSRSRWPGSITVFGDFGGTVATV